MKRLVIVNGAMGAGKTAVCRELLALMPPAAFLDGDWCWTMNPFQVTEETKALVLDNIVHVLQNFLRCPAYETVLFCWVLHRQEMLDGLLARLDTGGVQARCFTLLPTPAALEAHLQKDIAAGLRAPDVLQRSRAYLPLYEGMDTEKIVVDRQTPRETAREILARL